LAGLKVGVDLDHLLLSNLLFGGAISIIGGFEEANLLFLFVK
jgi:hypothetical protein